MWVFSDMRNIMTNNLKNQGGKYKYIQNFLKIDSIEKVKYKKNKNKTKLKAAKRNTKNSFGAFNSFVSL
jgi:hypothetical protein